MGEPARKLDREAGARRRAAREPERRRLIRLPASGTQPTEEEQWVLDAMMDCYCFRRD